MEHVLSVTDGIKEFQSSIKEKYRQRRVNREEQWPPCKTEKLVRLVLVERERIKALEQRGRADVVEKRTPLAYSDIFKVESGKKPVRKILVDGNAGIGKTTLCIAVSEDWASGRILQEFDLLLLLPLRQKKVAAVGSLLELLQLLHPNKEVCDCVIKYFEKGEGKVLIIADGWDELGTIGRDDESFLHRFLFDELYRSMSTLVTSRPTASTPLHRLPCIDRFIEVCGFNNDNINEYIQCEFSDNSAKANSLLVQLEDNPLIKSICSVPLNCAIICHLWRMLKEVLPATITELYTKMILCIILRNIRKFPAYREIVCISDFHDLPENLQQSWLLLCKFAFHTLQKDQLVFSEKELKGFYPQGFALNDDILCFGLLQSAESLLVVGCGRSFHFLHLTFQEYLAAFYLVNQECSSQVNDCSLLITKLFQMKQECYSQITVSGGPIVLRFFFGIIYSFQRFQNTISKRVLTVFTDNQHCLPYEELALCHWAFEAHNDEFVHTIVANQIRGKYPFPHTPHDFAAIVYVIANTPECTNMRIDFRNCGLRDSHITALADALANKAGKLQVKWLDLRGNELTNRGVTELFHRASAAFQSLICVHLGENRIGGEGINSVLATLASSCMCLEVEFVFNNNPLEVPSVKIFGDGLCSHQLSTLKELLIEGSLCSDANINAEFILAMGHCHNLRILNLSRNNLRAPGGRALGELLMQLSLQELVVDNTNLGDDGMAALTQSLNSTCHIAKLDLRSNDIHATGVSCLADSVYAGKIIIESLLRLCNNPLCLEGAMSLIKLLSSEHFQADHLYLQRCTLTTTESNIHTISPNLEESITCLDIREWISSNKIEANSIVVLHLNFNNFRGEGIHLLAGFLYMCPQLKFLYCSDCEITSDDLKLLFLFQLNLSLINTWCLRKNNIDDGGASALIKKFPSLTNIYIGDNQVSPEIITNLKEICEKRHKVDFFSLCFYYT